MITLAMNLARKQNCFRLNGASDMSIHNLDKVLERAESALIVYEYDEVCIQLRDADRWSFLIGKRRTNNDDSSDFMDCLKILVNEWKLNVFNSGWIKPGGVWDKD